MKNCFVIRDPDPKGYAHCIAELVPSYEMGLREGWIITRINVPESKRGMQLGTALLKMILAEADAEGQYLYLEIMSGGGLTRDELQAWYERHGFKRMSRYDIWKRRPQTILATAVGKS